MANSMTLTVYQREDMFSLADLVNRVLPELLQWLHDVDPALAPPPEDVNVEVNTVAYFERMPFTGYAGAHFMFGVTSTDLPVEKYREGIRLHVMRKLQDRMPAGAVLHMMPNN